MKTNEQNQDRNPESANLHSRTDETRQRSITEHMDQIANQRNQRKETKKQNKSESNMYQPEFQF